MTRYTLITTLGKRPRHYIARKRIGDGFTIIGEASTELEAQFLVQAANRMPVEQAFAQQAEQKVVKARFAKR